jgi:ferredoxin
VLRLNLDPIACDGHGLCAELLPELIALDDWGYPMVRVADVPPHLERTARTAAALCPKLALTTRPVAVPVAVVPGRRRPRATGDRRSVVR